MTQDDPQWEMGSDAGVHFEVVGETWYLFNRLVHWGDKPSYCPTETMSLEVRRSIDKGRTWTSPIEIISNEPGTAWECAATDGDAYYNETENRWHYLFQCLDRESRWNGCHAVREGLDPYGQFSPTMDNPVINSGEIWSLICTDPTKDCYTLSRPVLGRIEDEGTFDIFDYQEGQYLVNFHGFDGTRGYRGIAKTTDFRTWMPFVNDATLDLLDALPFATQWDASGPIGFGAGRMIKDKGYYYLISEAADKSIQCTEGQKWVVGMFRSPSVMSTNWEQLPNSNPFFTVDNFPDSDPNPLPCNPEYSGLFTTQAGEWYFHSSRPSYTPAKSGIYLYRLVPKVSGDLNLNGRVAYEDISVLLSGFGQIYSLFDFNSIVTNFGR